MITTPDGNIVFTPDELVKLCEKMGARTACKILGIQSPPPPDIPLNEPVDDEKELTVSDENSTVEEDFFNDEEESADEEEDEPVLDEESVDDEELEEESIDDEEPEDEPILSGIKNFRLDFFEEGKVEIFVGLEKRVIKFPASPWKVLKYLYESPNMRCDFESLVSNTTNEFQRKDRNDYQIVTSMKNNLIHLIKKHNLPIRVSSMRGEIELGFINDNLSQQRFNRVEELRKLYENNSDFSCTSDEDE